MAELNTKPFLPGSGFLGRIFKGFPAYYAEPDLRQYFESIEYNLSLLNSISVGDCEGNVVLRTQSAWNVQRTQYTLRLTLSDPFKIKVGKTEINMDSSFLDYVDIREFDGNINLNNNTLMLEQVTHVLVLADKETITYNDDPTIGGVVAPGMVQPLESSDAEYYTNFSVAVFKGAEIPTTVNNKSVVCILAQFTFQFDGYWKPLLIQNLRTNLENADSSGGDKFPIVNKYLGAFGRIELINQLFNTLNNLSLKKDGSNDATADIHLDKGTDGRFKFITEEDYATTTKAGIGRFATEEEIDDLSPATMMSPFATRKMMGFERRSYAIGTWNMNTEHIFQIAHDLDPGDWLVAVTMGISIMNNEGEVIFDYISMEGTSVEINENNITLRHKADSFFAIDDEYGTNTDPDFNRGYVIIDIIKDYQLPDASAPIVDAGPGQTLMISNLDYGTPLLKTVTKISNTYPNNLGTINATVEMGLNTDTMTVALQYQKQGSTTWTDFASDSNVNASMRNLTNKTLADYSIPMSGLYKIRPYVNANGTELIGNSIDIDFNQAQNTVWSDTTSTSVIVSATGGTPYVEATLSGSIVSYEGTLSSAGWSLVSGDPNALNWIGGTTNPISGPGTPPTYVNIVRFNTTGTWVFKFYAISTDGSANYTGSALTTINVGSSVIANPEALLKYQDGSVGTKYFSFTDIGYVDIFGTAINENAPTDWEFGFRSTINEYGILNQNFWPWSNTGFVIPQPAAPNVARFRVDRPFGMLELRVRYKDSNGMWTPYSNTLICSVDYSVTAPLFQPIGIPYLPDTGAMNFPITNARTNTAIRFKVRGNVVAPKFRLGYAGSIYYVEYDPNNVQILPAETVNYSRVFDTNTVMGNTNPLNLGNFNCNTSAGRNALKFAIANVLDSYESLIVAGAITGGGIGGPITGGALGNVGTIKDLVGESTTLSTIKFFQNIAPLVNDTVNSDGTWTIEIHFSVPRGTNIANEPLALFNPPQLAKRIRVIGNITNVSFS